MPPPAPINPQMNPTPIPQTSDCTSRLRALTVDYVTVAVVDAPGGEALTEDGLQVVESLLQ